MRIRLFTACLAGALAATVATAQDPAPPASDPIAAPTPNVSTPVPAPGADASNMPSIVIHAAEGPPRLETPGLMARVGALWRNSVPSVPPADTPDPNAAVPGMTTDGPSPLSAPGAAGAPGPVSRIWVNNEVLLWAIQGQRLPPLVTTSPTGTPAGVAGVLGGSAPTTILNPGSVNSGIHLGWRATAGTWLDDEHRFALEGQFLLLTRGSNVFSANSTGDPILTRPVVNTVTGTTVEPIAVPGVSTGGVRIANTNSGLLGTGIWIREAFHRSDDPCDTCRLCGRGGCGAGGCGNGCGNGTGPFGCYTRFDSLFGFRYLRMSDHLAIDDAVTPAAGFPGVPAGALLTRSDRFDAANSFYGVDLGATGEILRGPWSVSLLAKVAIGFNNSSADISGFNSVNGVIMPGAGGLLAQPTNFGHYTHTVASAVPELGIRLGYQVAPGIRISAGYTFLYWYNTVHAASQVDNNVDPAFLTQGTPTGTPPVSPSRPGLDERATWVQGVSVGFEWRY